MIARFRNINVRETMLSSISWIVMLLPLVRGAFNQIEMFMTGQTRSIYIIVDPPGNIRPLVSVEASWWVLLTIVTLIAMGITYASNLRAVKQTVYPLYFYLLFLIVFVKPVW